MPVDDVPYIGRLTPNEDRIFVATGFKKWGMTTGTVAGMILSETIQGRKSPWSEVFDATRMDIGRSAQQFITANLNVAKRFVGDRLTTMTAPNVSALGAGEGRIVEVDGAKLAAFRDEEGEVHAVSPHCSHMGCLVTWNTAERTWDCPCHGSRYDFDGRAIQGPTVKDLEPREVAAGPSSHTPPTSAG
jgi:Rieske Fe-S protein